MRTLDRKLVRDLGRLKGQVLTIALVVACGVASFVALRGNFSSLELARAQYYERLRFADVFAHLERAPGPVLADLEGIPGVSRAYGRVVEAVMLPLAGVSRPVSGQVISLPSGGAALNAVDLRRGRLPEPGHDEALLLEAFAAAHEIAPGDRVPVVLNGKRRDVTVVGLALSPEHVFAMAPGELNPDPERYAVLWMDLESVAAAFQMEGAFNDVTLALQPGASEAAVIDAADRILEPFGGIGAIGQSKQSSNYALTSELEQLRSMSNVVPVIFLAVAALLLNIVLSRLVFLARPDIATLKAVGYTSFEVGLHFAKLILVIAILGSMGGIALGAWLGVQMVDLYRQYFRFPNLGFNFDVASALAAIAISLTAAMAGAFGALRSVMKLPPAEAMRPPSPARYRRSLIDRLRLSWFVGPSAQMVARELERRPLRTLGSVLAIAASVGLMVVGGFYYAAMDDLVAVQFSEVMREDVSVAFHTPRPERAARELAHLPGVARAEGMRVVPVRFRAAHLHRDGMVWGYPDDAELRSLRDKFGRSAPMPPDGLVLTDKLAEILHVGVGDAVTLEVQDGERPRRNVTVTGLIDEAFGLQGHMRLDALRKLLGEERLVSLALLRVDPLLASEVDERLADTPHVTAVTHRADALARFEEQSAGMILTFSIIITLFAATITVGVVYNNARIVLSQRARDLASLRVLGFTRGEISAILLGEMAVQVLLALPLGLVLGRLLVWLLAQTVDPEVYRFPFEVTPQSDAFAVIVALCASVLSALLVRRRLDRLDLIGVLKTRE